nr:flavodoxin [Anaerolineae bacterium]
NIGDVPDLSALLDYDHLILGCPTWNIGQLQDDWDIAFPQFDKLDFSGKQVALFGVGDQYGYPDNFIDAVGTLGNKLEERGASLVGFWPCDGYEFSASKAVRNKVFIGLAIDEEHQSKQTPARISQWLEQVIAEFVLRPVVNS